MGWTVYNSDGQILQGSSTLADDAVTTAKILDANVTLAKIASQAANTVLVRDASSSGVVSAKAVTNTQILIGDGTGFTAAALSGDVTMANDGAVTIAATAVENSMLADDAVGADELAANAVVNASVASSAAIVFSKMENLTVSRALVSDGNGDVSVSAVTSTEVGYLDGVTSAIQTQIDAAGGAVTREGGNTDGSGSYQNVAEATSNSTSAVDFLAATSLTIQVAEHYMFSGIARKTTGGSGTMNLGLKQNAVITRTAENSGNARLFSTGAGNVADTGNYRGNIGPRIANYRTQGLGQFISYGAGTTQGGSGISAIGQDGEGPLAEVTSVTVMGISTTTDITMGVDELQVYSYAAS